jgi:hypothetical protein
MILELPCPSYSSKIWIYPPLALYFVVFYRDCEANLAIYQALHLEKVVNLTSILNLDVSVDHINLFVIWGLIVFALIEF